MCKNKSKKLKAKTKKYDFKLIIYVLAFLLFTFCFLLFAFAQNESIYDTKSKRNPFIPLVTSDGRLVNLEKEEKKVDLSVEGIAVDKYGRSYSIVNGLVVEVGDTVEGYRVLKIEEDKVIFIKEGQTRVVKLNKEEGK